MSLAENRFAIARFNTDGSLDVGFGSEGKATTNFTSQYDFAFGLALQADGNLLLAGGSGWGGSNPKVALARFLGTQGRRRRSAARAKALKRQSPGERVASKVLANDRRLEANYLDG